ncbi:MAG: hypothetical protein U0871_05230 [Gemmataceae bacterium]
MRLLQADPAGLLGGTLVLDRKTSVHFGQDFGPVLVVERSNGQFEVIPAADERHPIVPRFQLGLERAEARRMTRQQRAHWDRLLVDHKPQPTATTPETETMPATATAKKSRKPATEKKGKKAPARRDGSRLVHTPEEKELMAKYPHLTSLQPDTLMAGREGWGHKKTFIVKCPICEAAGTETLRIVATSDAQWLTSAYCKDCGKDLKRAAKAADKANTPKAK